MLLGVPRLTPWATFCRRSAALEVLSPWVNAHAATAVGPTADCSLPTAFLRP